jgi:uncharacterized membrane protein
MEKIKEIWFAYADKIAVKMRLIIHKSADFINRSAPILKKPGFWVFLTMLFFSLLFFTMAIANHYFFRTFTMDYGSYNFALRDYAHFHITNCGIYKICGGNYTFFQDHFSFVLIYLVPFYWLLNWLTGTYTLLLLQTSFILLSGWYLYRLILLKTGLKGLSLFALLMYFLLQGRYSAFLSDVNIGTISACMVPVFLYFFEKRKYFVSSIIFILALFSRENMAIWFIFICIVLMIWHRKDRKSLRICGIFIILSIVYFILLFKVFIPLVESRDKVYSLFNFAALGKGPGEAVKFILFHPVQAIKLFFINHSGDKAFDGVKLEFYIVYLVSGGFLLIYRPWYVIWFIPILALKMFNDSPLRWSIEAYYSVDVVTLLPISLALIIYDMNFKFIRPVVMILVLGLTLTMTLFKSEVKNRKMCWLGTGKEYIFHPSFFKSSYDIRLINHSLKLIPPDASVAASEMLIPHLSQRDTIYYYPYTGDARYVAIIENQLNYLVNEKSYNDSISKILHDPHWTILVHQSQLIIAKRNFRKL